MQIETDPSKVSAETHIFVGMFRQTFQQCLSEFQKRFPSGYPSDSDPVHYPWHRGGEQRFRDAWLMGRFDIPQYVPIEEYLKARRTDG